MNIELTIAIADDHPLFRKGLKQAIEERSGFKVVAEAADGDTALQLITQLRPDVAVLDIDMPGRSGLDVAKEIRQQHIDTGVVILTIHNDEELFNEAMDAGAGGYVLKESAVQDLLACIDTVANGRYYISPGISAYLLSRSRRVKELLEKRPSLQALTPSEIHILKLIALSKSSKEIAEELHISYRTVETHRVNISRKLNLHGNNSLLMFAIENRSALRDT